MSSQEIRAKTIMYLRNAMDAAGQDKELVRQLAQCVAELTPNKKQPCEHCFCETPYCATDHKCACLFEIEYK